MEESKELKNLYTLLQSAVYLTLFLEAMVLFGHQMPLYPSAKIVLARISLLPIYHAVFLSKGFTILLIGIVATGTKAKKNSTWQPERIHSSKYILRVRHRASTFEPRQE